MEPNEDPRGETPAQRDDRNFIELVPDHSPAHVFEVKRFVRSENQFEYFL